MNSNKSEQTFITWEQAVNMKQLVPVAEQYQKMIQEVLRTFQKNVLLQMRNMDTYFEAMELHKYFMQKDYSKFLFDKTADMMTKVSKMEADIQPLREKMQEMASLYSEAAMKEQKSDKE